MTSLNKLEKEIRKIRERNRRVEADKAWETSKTRKLIVSLATYLVISLFLLVAGVPNPFFTAIVPTLAFILSTLTLQIFKKFWLKYIYGKR